MFHLQKEVFGLDSCETQIQSMFNDVVKGNILYRYLLYKQRIK